MPFKPTQHVAGRLRTDRAISVGDIRTIEHQHDPDERVITLTMELSAQELMELELPLKTTSNTCAKAIGFTLSLRPCSAYFQRDCSG